MLGIDKDLIDESSPYELKPYVDAHKMWIEEQDTLAWISGMYVKSALETVLGSSFGKGNIKYLNQSVMAEMNKYEGLTQEEIDEIEIRKMIADEMRWSGELKQSGMKNAQV